MAVRAGAALCLFVVALVVPACGERSSGTETFQGIAPEDPGPIHVHGLGINPADGSLFIATHTGLYRTGPGETNAERITDRYQDTMGFSIVGADHFIGSGHPDVRDLRAGTPALLGLIESTDAGRSWKEVSLSGEADFHVLRFLNDRVYGYDSSNNRLLISSDGGKEWVERRVPGVLIDLAVNPARPGHLVASSSDDLLPGSAGGLHISVDDGATWKRQEARSGLLAWPAEDAFYVVDAQGSVFRSGDAGASWTPLGNVGGEPAAFVAQTTEELYTALHDGTIKVSLDGGLRWSDRSTP